MLKQSLFKLVILFTVGISLGNSPPIIYQIPDQEMAYEEILEIEFQYDDPDNQDNHTFDLNISCSNPNIPEILTGSISGSEIVLQTIAVNDSIFRYINYWVLPHL